MLVRVRWLDSGTNLTDGWQKTKELIETAPASIGEVETVGFLIMGDEVATVVGLSYDADNDAYFGVQVISTPSIRNLEVIG